MTFRTFRTFLNQWENPLTSMIKILLQTHSDYVYTFLRIIAGIIVFPYGMQKLFGWFSAPEFGAPGIKGSLEQLTARKIPKFIAWLIIIGQSLGSIALMSGFLGRIAAGGLFIIFTGALIVHLPDGWTLNWFGSKKGEGIEYFVLLLSFLLVIILKGRCAINRFLTDKMTCVRGNHIRTHSLFSKSPLSMTVGGSSFATVARGSSATPK